MVGLLCQSLIEGLAPIGEALPWRSVDQVEAHLKPSLARPLDHQGDARRVVRALESREHVRHSRLHAEGYACEARALQRQQVVEIHRVGVRLGRHLGSVDQPPRVDHRVQHRRQVGGRQEGRCAPAEEDRAHRPGWQAGIVQHASRQRHLSDGLARVVGALGSAQLVTRVRVEVAVSAANATERNVQVDPEVAGGRVIHDRWRQCSVERCGVRDRECAGRHQRLTRWKIRMSRRAVFS